ncbi:MAG: hypothetical protein AB7G48_09560 [Nitrospiraceae bacterium]
MVSRPLSCGNHRYAVPFVLSLLSAIADPASAQEALLDLLPIKPINLDIAIRKQTFALSDREIGIQAGFTALRYGDLELRAIYQFFSVRTEEFTTDQHSVFLNPRWNNFTPMSRWNRPPASLTPSPTTMTAPSEVWYEAGSLRSQSKLAFRQRPRPARSEHGSAAHSRESAWRFRG